MMKFPKLSKRQLISLVSLLIILVFLVTTKFGPHFYDLYAVPQKTVRDLPIMFAAGNREDLIGYFNQIARDDDARTGDIIGFFEYSLEDKEKFERSISLIQKGLIFYNFASWQTAEENVSYLKDKIDGFSYDLEQWPKSRGEWENISYSSQQMQRVAHTNGLLYSGALSYQLAKEPGSIEDMAEFTDVYGPPCAWCLKRKSRRLSRFFASTGTKS